MRELFAAQTDFLCFLNILAGFALVANAQRLGRLQGRGAFWRRRMAFGLFQLLLAAGGLVAIVILLPLSFSLVLDAVLLLTALGAGAQCLSLQGRYLRFSARDEAMSAALIAINRRMLAGLGCLLLLGWLGVNLAGFYETRHEEVVLSHLAHASAAAVNPRRLKTLTGTEADTVHPDYLRLREQLNLICASHPGLRQIRLYALVDGAFRPAVIVGRSPMAPPEWTDATRPAPTAAASVRGPGPGPDEPLFTTIAPILDLELRHVLGILALDVSATPFLARYRLMRLAAILVTSFLTLIVLAVAVSAKREIEKRDIRRQSRASEEHLVDLYEAVSRELAAELHDGVGQYIAGIRMQTSSLSRKIAAGQYDVARLAAETAALARQAADELRLVLRRQYPPELDTVDLGQALAHLASQVETLFNARCGFAGPLSSLPLAGKGPLLQLYRLTQEAITNLIKHREADELTIRLAETSEGWRIEVSANGKATEALATAGGIGRRIMQYRARSLGAELAWLPDARPPAPAFICRLPGRAWRAGSETEELYHEAHSWYNVESDNRKS